MTFVMTTTRSETLLLCLSYTHLSKSNFGSALSAAPRNPSVTCSPRLMRAAWLLPLACLTIRVPLVSASKPILVVGATGKVGQLVVKQLSLSGQSVRALARDPDSDTAAALASLTGVDVVQGDVLDRAAMESAVTGCSVVISVSCDSMKSSLEDLIGVPPPIFRTDLAFDQAHPQQVNYVGLVNTIGAMQGAGLSRIVRLTGLSCSFSAFNPFVMLIGCGLLSMSTAWHSRSENLLRESTLDYTILRPGGLSDDARGTNTLSAASRTLPLAQGRIGRADLAALAIEAACGKGGKRATVACGWAKEGEGADSWAPLLEAIPSDEGPLPLEPYRLAVGLLLGGVLGVTLLVETTFAKVLFG